MERFIGMDVHAGSCTLVVLSESGRRTKKLVVETNGEALIEAISLVPGRKHICFEEGTQSAWLYEILKPRVDSVTVTGVTDSRGQKSDLIDAHRLAESLRRGTVDIKVYKDPKRFSMLRELSRIHIMNTRDRVRVQLRIKSVYRARGLPTPGPSVYHRAKREQFVSNLPCAAKKLVTHLYGQYDFLRESENAAERELVKESRRHSISKILETCPGLGPIRVARLLPLVMTPHRFRSKRQFWSYVGLGIVTRSSADWIQEGTKWKRAQVMQPRGLNRQHNSVLKDVFKGAATTVIVQHPGDPLHADYQTMLEAGTKPNLAKLSLARKIAAIALRMWKNQEVYDTKKYRTPIAARS